MLMPEILFSTPSFSSPPFPYFPGGWPLRGDPQKLALMGVWWNRSKTQIFNTSQVLIALSSFLHLEVGQKKVLSLQRQGCMNQGCFCPFEFSRGIAKILQVHFVNKVQTWFFWKPKQLSLLRHCQWRKKEKKLPQCSFTPSKVTCDPPFLPPPPSHCLATTPSYPPTCCVDVQCIKCANNVAHAIAEGLSSTGCLTGGCS